MNPYLCFRYKTIHSPRGIDRDISSESIFTYRSVIEWNDFIEYDLHAFFEAIKRRWSSFTALTDEEIPLPCFISDDSSISVDPLYRTPYFWARILQCLKCMEHIH